MPEKKEFKMPMVAESVVEGEVGKWFVKPGDHVTQDQNLVEVLTDKVNVEIPSPFDGEIVEVVVPEGQTAKVGDVLLTYIESVPLPSSETPVTPATPVTPVTHPSPDTQSTSSTESEITETPAEPETTAQEPAKEQWTFKEQQVPHPEPVQPEKQSADSAQDTQSPPVSGQVLATPAVRRMAREMGIDLSRVKGSGTAGRITEDDLKSHTVGQEPPTPHQPPSPPDEPVSVEQQKSPAPGVVQDREERIPFKGIRRTVSEHMVRSRQTAVSTLHVDEADVTDLVALRDEEKAKASEMGIKLTYLPFFIKAIIGGLKQYPTVNSSLDEDTQELVLKHYYNIGIATDTDQGLIVPVIKDADRKDIWQLAAEIQELAEKARSGKLELADVQNSTFSITNVGSLHGKISFPIINLPNAAIMGIQSIEKRPVVRNDAIAIRYMVNLSFVFDHRIFDGATASRFTSEVIDRLGNPALLIDKQV